MIAPTIAIINPFPNKPWFLRVCSTSHLKTLWEKEKLLVTSNFSFSRSVFYLFGELAAIFIKSKIVLCQSFEYGRVKYLSFGKGLILMLSCIGLDVVTKLDRYYRILRVRYYSKR